MNTRMFLILFIIGAAFLALPLTTAHAQDNQILNVVPQRLFSWVEVQADSIEKAQDLAKETAMTALDSIATSQGVKIDSENVAYKATYLGIWKEMEGRGRRQKEVVKGFKVRMKATSPIIKEE